MESVSKKEMGNCRIFVDIAEFKNLVEAFGDLYLERSEPEVTIKRVVHWQLKKKS